MTLPKKNKRIALSKRKRKKDYYEGIWCREKQTIMEIMMMMASTNDEVLWGWQNKRGKEIFLKKWYENWTRKQETEWKKHNETKPQSNNIKYLAWCWPRSNKAWKMKNAILFNLRRTLFSWRNGCYRTGLEPVNVWQP